MAALTASRSPFWFQTFVASLLDAYLSPYMDTSRLVTENIKDKGKVYVV